MTEIQNWRPQSRGFDTGVTDEGVDVAVTLPGSLVSNSSDGCGRALIGISASWLSNTSVVVAVALTMADLDKATFIQV